GYRKALRDTVAQRADHELGRDRRALQLPVRAALTLEVVASEAVTRAVHAVVLEGVGIGRERVVVPHQSDRAVERGAHQAGRLGEHCSCTGGRAGGVRGARGEGNHREYQPRAHVNLLHWKAMTLSRACTGRAKEAGEGERKDGETEGP